MRLREGSADEAHLQLVRSGYELYPSSPPTPPPPCNPQTPKPDSSGITKYDLMKDSCQKGQDANGLKRGTGCERERNIGAREPKIRIGDCGDAKWSVDLLQLLGEGVSPLAPPLARYPSFCDCARTWGKPVHA